VWLNLERTFGLKKIKQTLKLTFSFEFGFGFCGKISCLNLKKYLTALIKRKLKIKMQY
jgi:hypothetical protein